MFALVCFVEIPPVTALIGGMKLPDQMLFGYDQEGARALFAAFMADQTAADLQGRASASQAYLKLHAGCDPTLPPLLAASLVFWAFVAWKKPVRAGRVQHIASVGFGLAMALALTYLISDLIENHIADTIFGPDALKQAFNKDLALGLQVLTGIKFASLALAIALIAALWFGGGETAHEKSDRAQKAKPALPLT
ncbi:hypothetical protein [Hoeflea halophila]|uniref:hypothetical protein n=1 Tax=Hoeflea halophila TaxID=714899 RepID=UPI00117BD91F|nr:hypothetical protein [Hoeflea halophila]